jgi:hypothetical protein
MQTPKIKFIQALKIVELFLKHPVNVYHRPLSAAMVCSQFPDHPPEFATGSVRTGVV